MQSYSHNNPTKRYNSLEILYGKNTIDRILGRNGGSNFSHSTQPAQSNQPNCQKSETQSSYLSNHSVRHQQFSSPLEKPFENFTHRQPVVIHTRIRSTRSVNIVSGPATLQRFQERSESFHSLPRMNEGLVESLRHAEEVRIYALGQAQEAENFIRQARPVQNVNIKGDIHQNRTNEFSLPYYPSEKYKRPVQNHVHKWDDDHKNQRNYSETHNVHVASNSVHANQRNRNLVVNTQKHVQNLVKDTKNIETFAEKKLSGELVKDEVVNDYKIEKCQEQE